MFGTGTSSYSWPLVGGGLDAIKAKADTAAAKVSAEVMSWETQQMQHGPCTLQLLRCTASDDIISLAATSMTCVFAAAAVLLVASWPSTC